MICLFSRHNAYPQVSPRPAHTTLHSPTRLNSLNILSDKNSSRTVLTLKSLMSFVCCRQFRLQQLLFCALLYVCSPFQPIFNTDYLTDGTCLHGMVGRNQAHHPFHGGFLCQVCQPLFDVFQTEHLLLLDTSFI